MFVVGRLSLGAQDQAVAMSASTVDGEPAVDVPAFFPAELKAFVKVFLASGESDIHAFGQKHFLRKCVRFRHRDPPERDFGFHDPAPSDRYYSVLKTHFGRGVPHVLAVARLYPASVVAHGVCA